MSTSIGNTLQEVNQILDLINCPKDLKKLDSDELGLLADEIREKIIKTTSKTGGHVASSLGAVEIILAVHSVIDCPKDKFIFDVGHQSYAHKMVTGRAKDFDTLREFGGLSGFPKPIESKYDVHYSGHASDSLSIALGLARAKKLRGTNESIVTLIGDASIAGGMSFEALNQIGQEQLPMVIILNENNQSIAPTVGGLKNHLNALRFSEQYRSTSDRLKEHLLKLGSFGQTAVKFGTAGKDTLKQFLLPKTMLFEDLGIVCSQTIDGHDINRMQKVLKKAISANAPVLIHVTTEKGAGYEPAFMEPERFHGTGPYQIDTGKPSGDNAYTFTNAFSDAIIQEAQSNKKIIAMTAAMASGTGLDKFSKVFPEKFIDVGIAEQHLLGYASGLAIGGYKPVISVYSTFLQRAIDQLIVNTALQSLDVIVCVDRAGIVGADGVTHHGVFDISYGCMIPKMTVATPSCAYELKRMLHTAIKKGGPWMIRYPKGAATDISDAGNILKNVIRKKPEPIKVGQSRLLKSGSDVSILAFGETVVDAIEASNQLKQNGVSARVVDMRFAKPIDKKAVVKAAKETKRIVTIEDGVLSGGAGSQVLHILCENDLIEDTKFISLGVNDEFVTHGDVKTLKHVAKIDTDGILCAVKDLLQ